MKHLLLGLLCVLLALPVSSQVVRDDFNRPATDDISGSGKWRKVPGLSHPSASIQINTDGTVSPYSPLGPYERGAAYWDSTVGGRFLVGVILRHKSGSHNIPTFHIHLMNDTNWLTGDGYALRFQENSGQDRFDIQRLTGSGADTPFVNLLANFNREFTVGDTLMFKFYQDGTKTAVRYGADGTRDSLSVVDLFHNPPAWYAWIQGRVFPDRTRWDDFMIGPIPYKITAAAGPGGAISPPGAVHVDPGADTYFAITPQPGYQVADVIVDAVSLGPLPGYTFSGVASDHSISASFQAQSFTIAASAGPNGSIVPSGQVSVGYGASRSFTIAPAPGYSLDSLLVDGVPVDSTTGYTFVNVTANHTIDARFAVNMYTITSSAGTGGTIAPHGAVPVAHGAGQSFVAIPDPGYSVASILVDSAPVDSVSGYTFTAVTSDHAIHVAFGERSETGAYPVRERWNMVSVPLRVPDFSRGALYPAASGNAYAYSGGYVAHDTLTSGRAYWLKFPGDDTVSMTGVTLARDTIEVTEGWNMIGSISMPVAASDVISIPGGLRSSGFFGYAGTYEVSPTIVPGRGYWVKLSAAGLLVLDAASGSPPSTTLRIVPDAELPPSPPGIESEEGSSGLTPVAFELSQNYPNPFNPATTIDISLPADTYVRLAVYDILGRQVAVIMDGIAPAGAISVKFIAGSLPSGVYSYRIRAGSFTQTRRMLLTR